MVHPDPSQFQLVHGYFVNEDGTATTLLQQFSLQASGILLAGPVQTLEWLKVAANRPADELGILVLGPITVPPQFDHEEVQAPATDAQQRDLLLTGTLIHVGHKRIQVSKSEGAYDTEATQIASITAWKADYDAETWKKIVQAPVRTLQAILSAEGFPNIMSRPWGRVFQDSGVVVKPHLATSVQFHAIFESGSRLCYAEVVSVRSSCVPKLKAVCQTIDGGSFGYHPRFPHWKLRAKLQSLVGPPA